MASVVQGHRNPFGKPLVEYTVVELDFVLEMAALDEPDRWSFVRGGRKSGTAAPAAMARWSDALGGGLFRKYMDRTGLTRGIAAVTSWRRKQGGGMKPGFTRGGKPVDARDPD
jgi:hypothetical protein